MTENEFNYWKSKTNESKFHWMSDETQWYNHKRLLLYKGGEDGIYIELEKDGMASYGIYKNAYPHIGEAIFQELKCKKFESQEIAIRNICKTPELLLAITGIYS